jgi:hypothetical protein
MFRLRDNVHVIPCQTGARITLSDLVKVVLISGNVF